MVIYLDYTTKALNSTYQFEVDPSGEFEGEIWDNTSVLSPTIRFNNASATITQYTLAKIPKFSNRYYFISDWIWKDGAWNAQMSVDVLATYKQQIGNFQYYITRASAVASEDIIDAKFPTAGGRYSKVSRVQTGWSKLEGLSSYVLGVYGGEQGDATPISYYVLSNEQMSAFKQAMFSTADWLNPDLMGISADLAKGLVNPIQYIASCRWYPFLVAGEPQPDDPEMPSVGIRLGWWTVPGGEGYVMSNPGKRYTYTIPIPKSNGKKYNNLSPYAEYWLYCGPFGHIPVDSSLLYDGENLLVHVDIDCKTGIGVLWAADPSNSRTIFIREMAQFGVDMPIPGRSYDLLGTATGAVNDAAKVLDSVSDGFYSASLYAGTGQAGKMIGKMATGVIGGALNALSGVANAVAGVQPNVNVRGSMGTDIIFDDVGIFLYGVFRNQTYHAQDTFGNPVMRSIKPSEIPGYIEIAKPYLRPGATDEEKSAIGRYMESGFYYE